MEGWREGECDSGNGGCYCSSRGGGTVCVIVTVNIIHSCGSDSGSDGLVLVAAAVVVIAKVVKIK